MCSSEAPMCPTGELIILAIRQSADGLTIMQRSQATGSFSYIIRDFAPKSVRSGHLIIDLLDGTVRYAAPSVTEPVGYVQAKRMKLELVEIIHAEAVSGRLKLDSAAERWWRFDNDELLVSTAHHPQVGEHYPGWCGMEGFDAGGLKESLLRIAGKSWSVERDLWEIASIWVERRPTKGAT